MAWSLMDTEIHFVQVVFDEAMDAIDDVFYSFLDHCYYQMILA